MKTNLFLIAVLFAALVSFAQTERIYPSMEVDGLIYSNCTVHAINPAEAVIGFSGGGVKVAISNLDSSLQSDLHFNQTNADHFIAARAQKESAWQTQRAAQVAGIQQHQATELPSDVAYIEKQIRDLRAQSSQLSAAHALENQKNSLARQAGELNRNAEKDIAIQGQAYAKQQNDIRKQIAALQLEDLNTRELHHLPLQPSK